MNEKRFCFQKIIHFDDPCSRNDYLSHSLQRKCSKKPLPPIPKCRSFKQSLPTRNFRKENKRAVINSNPPRKDPRYVDTQNGDFHELMKSGLLPIYIYKPNFGNLPKYISKQKNAHVREKNEKVHPKRDQQLCCSISKERFYFREGEVLVKNKNVYHFVTKY